MSPYAVPGAAAPPEAAVTGPVAAAGVQPAGSAGPGTGPEGSKAVQQEFEYPVGPNADLPAGPGGADGQGLAPSQPRDRSAAPAAAQASAGAANGGKARGAPNEAPLDETGKAPARPAGRASRAERGARPLAQGAHPGGVFLRRWLALALVVGVVVAVLVVAFQSHVPTLYWQGEPLTNGGRVLSSASAAMRGLTKADEGALSAESRCYFSLPTRSSHDVAPYVRCGPVLLPWSSPSKAWLTFGLSGRLTSSGERLSVVLAPAPKGTVALAPGEVLRRPDGVAAPVGDAGLKVPAVPRLAPAWGGVLSAPPPGLSPAPVGDLIGDWGESYRLVAYGEVPFLRANLDQAALRQSTNPPGSAWSTVAGSSSRPLATLLLPPEGQVLVVAEIALSPGESAGPVPAEANGVASTDQPSLEVLGGTTAVTFQVAGEGASSSGGLTVAACVPAGSKPVLEVTDKGLSQEVSLVDGALAPGPSILARAGANEVLDITGSIPGASVHVSDASLVWFAGSDGGTVPPEADEAYLQVLASASPLQASFLPASDFTLEFPGGTVPAVALPDSDREAIVVGFLVPASFSDGTVVVAAGGRSFDVAVNFA